MSRRRGRQEPNGPDARDATKRVIAKAEYYTLVFFAAGMLVAVAGSAIVAWLLSTQGLPFLKTWLVCIAVVVLPGLGAAIWNLIRGR